MGIYTLGNGKMEGEKEWHCRYSLMVNIIMVITSMIASMAKASISGTTASIFWVAIRLVKR